MNNSNISDANSRALVSYYLYAIEGLLLLISNGLILGTIIKHEVLRSKREYMVVAALALGDFWNASGYFAGGIYRSMVIHQGLDNQLLTAWECTLKPHNLIWVAGEHAAFGMLVCISLDRLIAVSFPLQYYGFGRRYAIGLASIFYIYALLVGGILLKGAYDKVQIPEFPAICFLSAAFGTETIKQFYRNSRSTLAIVSIILYFPVVVIYRKRMASIGPSVAQNIKEEEKKQKRFVVTIGLSTLCTFIFAYGMSQVIVWTQNYSQTVYYTFSPYADVIKNLNSFMNIILFTLRHKEMRMGMRYLLKCKHLSENALKTQIHKNTPNKSEMTAKKALRHPVQCENSIKSV